MASGRRAGISVLVAVAGVLGVAVAGGPGATAQDVACAPAVAVGAPAVPGGDGALAAAQPGPVPGSVPVRCWFAAVTVNILAGDGVLLDPVVAMANDAAEVVALSLGDGSEAWRYAVADAGTGQVHGLAAGDGAIYAAGPEGLTALEATDGTRRWRFRVSSDAILLDLSGFFWPVAQAGAIYGVTYSTEDDVTWDRRLVALDAATGDARWDAPLSLSLAGPPSSDGEIVVVAPGDGTLVVFEAGSGETRWVADVAALGAFPVTRPAIGAGLVIVGVGDGNAVALDAATGAVAWRSPTESGTVASVTFAGQTVLVSGSTTLAAVDPQTGTAAWSVPIAASAPMFAIASIPGVVGDTVVVGTTDAMDVIRVLALDVAAGAERWRFDTEAYGTAFSPLIAGGRVYLPVWDLTGSSGLVALGQPG